MPLTKIQPELLPAQATRSKKNIVINANMDIWQRGTSFAAIADDTYTADRFAYYKSGAMVHTAAQETNVPTLVQSGINSSYSLDLTLTTPDDTISAGDYSYIRYGIEGYDFRRIAGGSFTLSFWVKATTTGTYCVSFRNSGGTKSYIAEYTIDSTASWEKKTITISHDTTGTWDYVNGAGMFVGFTISAGATYQTTADVWQTGDYFATSSQVNGTATGSTNFRIGVVQIEAGSVATEFEERHIVDEIIMCQRYYEKSYNIDVDPGTVTSVGRIDEVSTRNSATTTPGVRFGVLKRNNPTIVIYSPGSGAAGYVNNDGAKAASVGSTGTSGFGYVNITSGITGNGAEYQYTADADL